jgi:hypothetical protein
MEPMEPLEPRETMRGIPRVLQPYLTWVTGVPLHGDRQLISWSPNKAGVLGIVQIAGGIALGTLVLHPLTPWAVLTLPLCWLIISGGMRRLDVVVVHQTLHRMFTKSARGNRIIGEVVSTLFWRTPYDENRKEHLLHHAYPCSMKDSDTRYLLSTGMRPGMSRQEFRRYLWTALLSPKHHWGFFSGRVRSNIVGVAPRYRLVMSIGYAAGVIGLLAATGWWVDWLVLWLIPISVVFQGATYLYTMTEHRWWIHDNAEKLNRVERDELTFGRFCGEPVPAPGAGSLAHRAAAWTTWWFRMLVVHSSYRMFVLVGDTVQHDLHHVHPTCDWANSAYVRSEDIAKGSERYTDVWGSLMDHLHEAGSVAISFESTGAAEPVAAGAS